MVTVKFIVFDWPPTVTVTVAVFDELLLPVPLLPLPLPLPLPLLLPPPPHPNAAARHTKNTATSAARDNRGERDAPTSSTHRKDKQRSGIKISDIGPVQTRGARAGTDIPDEDGAIARVAVTVAPAARLVDDGVKVPQLKLLGKFEHVTVPVIDPLKPFCEMIENESEPELLVLARVTNGSADERRKLGAVGHLLTRLPTFTEPRPVARSYPVPAL